MPPWLRGNVLALGIVSLLNDAASEMIAPFLPMFLTATLGGGVLALGIVEGLGDATANVLKYVTGRASDRGRRVPWLFGGYAVSTLAKPMIAIATLPWHVAVVRTIDRTGKGLRTSPRDALLADAVAPENRGAAFGFHRAMDHGGAVLGPLLALGLLWLTNDDLPLVFSLSAIPGVLVLVSIAFGVRESPPALPAQPAQPADPANPAVEPAARSVDASATAAPTTPAARAPVWRLLVPIALFAMARASDGVILLRCSGDLGPKGTALLWAGLHVVRSLLSTPLGACSDHLGRTTSLKVSWAWAIGVYVALAWAADPRLRIALFLLYGVHTAFGEGAEKALIAHYAHRGGQGTAFGTYHLVVGMVAIPGGLLWGAIWDAHGPEAAFLCGAALAGVALIGMFGTRESA